MTCSRSCWDVVSVTRTLRGAGTDRVKQEGSPPHPCFRQIWFEFPPCVFRVGDRVSLLYSGTLLCPLRGNTILSIHPSYLINSPRKPYCHPLRAGPRDKGKGEALSRDSGKVWGGEDIETGL